MWREPEQDGRIKTLLGRNEFEDPTRRAEEDEEDMKVSTRFIRTRTGSGGGLLWKRLWDFRLRKRRGMCSPTVWLSILRKDIYTHTHASTHTHTHTHIRCTVPSGIAAIEFVAMLFVQNPSSSRLLTEDDWTNEKNLKRKILKISILLVAMFGYATLSLILRERHEFQDVKVHDAEKNMWTRKWRIERRLE
jgi:hypothetical protein